MSISPTATARPMVERTLHRVVHPFNFIRIALLAALVGGALISATPPASALSNTPHPTWMTNGTVYAIARSKNLIYIGGSFTQLRERPPGSGGKVISVDNVAAIDAKKGTGVATWNPHVNGPVYALALSASADKVFMGGTFASVGGQSRTNMAAVDAVTGAIDPTFRPRVGGSTSKVRTILVSATRVYVGGGFTTANGKTRKNLAAFDLSGNLDSTWAPAADNGVRDLEFSSDGAMIFIGGWFATISGLPRQSVARVTPDTGAVDPWSVPSGIIATGEVAYGLVPTPTRLYVGMGGPLNYAAAYDLSNGNTGTQKWRAGTSGNVNCITKWGSMLVIGGHFTSVRLDPTRVRLAGLNLDGSLVSDWVPKITGSTGGPWNLLSTSTQLYVGGAFTTVSGIEQTYLAEFTA